MKFCNIDECGRDHIAKGLCKLHYDRQRKTGQTHLSKVYTKGLPLKERLDAFVKSKKDCWEWGGSKCGFGYGALRVNGRMEKAHRMSFEVYIGKIPKGLYVLHKCDNPGCINPKHLFAGTPKDNAQDMIAKGRDVRQRGSENKASKLNEEDVLYIVERVRCGASISCLAKLNNVSTTTIYGILSGRIWSWLTGI